jgi:hypothetical protein
MSTAIGLRADFDATRLRAIAKQAKDGPQARRLLPLASIYEGATRTEAAKIGGVTLQIVRDWVLKFNAHGPEGSLNRKAPGQIAGASKRADLLIEKCAFSHDRNCGIILPPTAIHG